MADLLKYFPYDCPREIQAQALKVLGDAWDKYDVFVVGAPTAFGKTAVARTIMNAFQSVSVITPTNMLVKQFQDEFPDTCTLQRLDSYRCAEWQRPCSITRGKFKAFCKGCPASKDLAQAKYRRGPGIYTYHMYLAQKLFRDVLVVDEAHNLIPMIRERMALTLWQHDYRYPGSMFSIDAMRAWMRGLPASSKRHKKMKILEDSLESAAPEFIPSRSKEWFNGKGTIRGEPEERDCIKLMPVDIRGAPAFFWPKDVSKIVLLSATISSKDIQVLGLDRKRVLFINCESPIPASSRPIVLDPVASVNRHNLETATQNMAEHILKVLAPVHEGQKGLIHATYQQATILRESLGHDPRFLFHDRLNKAEIYKQFRELPSGSGAVLVASGMYEGIDLPEDLGRWQVLCKIPWPSLGNPMIKRLSDQDPAWYSWETWKVVMQSCGRICRTPEDFGVSYCLDSSMNKLLQDASHMLPAWFQDGLDAGR